MENLSREVKKYKWTYRFIDKGDDSDFEIIPEIPIPLPETLYKFYALNNFSLDALLKSYIYAPSPHEVNDLFDCDASLIEFGSFNDVFSVLKGGYSEDEAKLLWDNNPDLIKEIFRTRIYLNSGIISLTKEINSNQIWAYYTNHQGFSIEFVHSEFKFKHYGPFPINYQDEIIPISTSESGYLAMLYQTNIKTIKWKHEKEWRIFIANLNQNDNREIYKIPGINYDTIYAERKFNYSQESIKSITFGYRFFDIDERIDELDTIKITLKNNVYMKMAFLNHIINQPYKKMFLYKDKSFFKLIPYEISIYKSDNFNYELKKAASL